MENTFGGQKIKARDNTEKQFYPGGRSSQNPDLAVRNRSEMVTLSTSTASFIFKALYKIN